MTNDLVSCPCSAPYDLLVVVDDYAYFNGQSIVSNLYAMKMLEESRVVRQHPQLIQTENTTQASPKFGGIRENLKLSCLTSPSLF